MERLNRSTAPQAKQYTEKIIQFGEGNFLRAFIEWIIWKTNQKTDFNASVVVVQPIDRGMVDMLNEQDCLYHLNLQGLLNGEPVDSVDLIDVISRGINPYADFMFNGLQFHAGFTMGWDGFTADNAVTFRFFPDLVVSKKLMNDAMVLSVGATGGFDPNNWDVIRKANPYVGPNAEQRATRRYDLLGHMRWSLSKKLEFNAEISYSFLQDDLTFSLDTAYKLLNVFRTHYFDNNRFTMGADIAFVNDEMLTLRAAGHYYHYNLKGGESVALYRPDWDISLTADVNYKDKWFFHLEGLLLGSMEGDFGETLPVRFGLNAEVEYRHNRALSFFLKMDNLTFQRYNLWVNYPSQRALFLIGLTYTL